MSFNAPSAPPPLQLPQAPAPVAPLQFTTTQQRPGRKASQPTSFLGEALTATGTGPSLIGGAGRF